MKELGSAWEDGSVGNSEFYVKKYGPWKDVGAHRRGLYMIEVGGKIYIGAAWGKRGIVNRLNNHFCEKHRQTHSSKKLYQAWRTDATAHIVMLVGDDITNIQIQLLETIVINLFGAFNHPHLIKALKGSHLEPWAKHLEEGRGGLNGTAGLESAITREQAAKGGRIGGKAVMASQRAANGGKTTLEILLKDPAFQAKAAAGTKRVAHERAEELFLRAVEEGMPVNPKDPAGTQWQFSCFNTRPFVEKYTALATASITLHIFIPPEQEAGERRWIHTPRTDHQQRLRNIKMTRRLIFSLRATYPDGRSEQYDIHKTKPRAKEEGYAVLLESFEGYFDAFVAEGRLDGITGRPITKAAKVTEE
ncbi:hypothetical protein HDV00_011982 [Rhizophlyctis rosea]|nr:hypothetical protein HDV00_011982 [Rhizophlyctis rosea]